MWNSDPKLPKLQSVVTQFVTVNWSCQPVKQTNICLVTIVTILPPRVIRACEWMNRCSANRPAPAAMFESLPCQPILRLFVLPGIPSPSLCLSLF